MAAAAALIQPLASEHLYAAGVAIKKKKVSFNSVRGHPPMSSGFTSWGQVNCVAGGGARRVNPKRKCNCE